MSTNTGAATRARSFGRDIRLMDKVGKADLSLTATLFGTMDSLVRSRRLELPLRLRNSDLNAARLPIPARPHCLRLGLAAYRPARQRCEAENQHFCQNVRRRPTTPQQDGDLAEETRSHNAVSRKLPPVKWRVADNLRASGYLSRNRDIDSITPMTAGHSRRNRKGSSHG